VSTGSGEETPGDVGSVGEEAAKLFGALSEWARDHGPALGEGLQDLADHAAAAAHDVGDHVDTGAAECSWCPLCRTVHLVRTPEVREHLAVAGASLLQAASAILAAASQQPSPEQPAVEHIDLDGEWPEEEP
jgi:hypothetical protein